MNLIQILKNVYKGRQLYSPLFGNVVFMGIENSENESKIRVKAEDGNEYLFYENGEFFKGFSEYECMLFPSKTNRDWDNFNQEDLRFDPNTLNPFDKVLVRDDNNYQWSCSLFSHVSTDDNTFDVVTLDGCTNYQTIPYNDETKHLLGTKDGAPQFYRYWED